MKYYQNNIRYYPNNIKHYRNNIKYYPTLHQKSPNIRSTIIKVTSATAKMTSNITNMTSIFTKRTSNITEITSKYQPRNIKDALECSENTEQHHGILKAPWNTRNTRNCTALVLLATTAAPGGLYTISGLSPDYLGAIFRPPNMTSNTPKVPT